jgi:hypothetical protein
VTNDVFHHLHCLHVNYRSQIVKDQNAQIILEHAMALRSVVLLGLAMNPMSLTLPPMMKICHSLMKQNTQ